MRRMISILLITANSLTSLIIIALGSSLFIFPDADITHALQSYTGIYVIFALLCLCEPIKWINNKKALEFTYHKTMRFFLPYGVMLMATSILYQLNFFPLVGLLYIACYFISKRMPRDSSNVMVEKKVAGQPLKSDAMFRPLPKQTNDDRNSEK